MNVDGLISGPAAVAGRIPTPSPLPPPPIGPYGLSYPPMPFADPHPSLPLPPLPLHSHSHAPRRVPEVRLRSAANHHPLSFPPPPPPSSRPTELLDHVLPASRGRYAYVFLVMKGDSYAVGALIGAYSLRLAGTKNDLLCMVTPDVSQQCRTRLLHIFSAVEEVPYLEYEVKPLRTHKQRSMYNNWVEAAFTKWNMLKLVQYEKCLFIDADKLCLDNLDHLFTEMQTPAGTFSSPWSQPFVGRKDELAERKAKQSQDKPFIPRAHMAARGMMNPYRDNDHASRVTSGQVYAGLTQQSFVVIGTMLMLSPNLEDYEQYKRMLTDMKPFGFESCHSMMDEQSISYYFSIHKNKLIQNGEYGKLTAKEDGDAAAASASASSSSKSSSSSSSSSSSRYSEWSYIHHRYNYVPWHRYWLSDDDVPYVFHFFNCFPVEDHQILTEHGFMFLADMKQHFARHPTLGIACFVDGTLQYHDITPDKIIEHHGKHRHILFDVAGDSVQGEPAMSLMPTDNHRMWVRLDGVRRSTRLHCPPLNKEAPCAIHTAGELYDAGISCESATAQFATSFPRGLMSNSKSGVGRLPCEGALGLRTAAHVDAFLELYGYWLGQRDRDRHRDSDRSLNNNDHAIAFEPANPNHWDYLNTLFIRLAGILPIINSTSAWNQTHDRDVGGAWRKRSECELHGVYVAPNPQLGEKDKIRPYYIYSEQWWNYFAEQHGHQYQVKHVEGLAMMSARRTRLLLAGMHMATGENSVDTRPHTPGTGLSVGVIYTSSVSLRDEIVRLALHAGYATSFQREVHGKGEQRDNIDGRMGVATRDKWSVSFSSTSTAASPRVCLNTSTKQVEKTGTVWCVSVPTAQQLIMVRRVKEVSGGIVTAADRPIIVGNTKPWQMDRSAWLDLESWWELVECLLNDSDRLSADVRADLRLMYPATQLAQKKVPGCCWCRLTQEAELRAEDALTWQQHNVFDKQGRIECPELRAGFERDRKIRQKEQQREGEEEQEHERRD